MACVQRHCGRSTAAAGSATPVPVATRSAFSRAATSCLTPRSNLAHYRAGPHPYASAAGAMRADNYLYKRRTRTLANLKFLERDSYEEVAHMQEAVTDGSDGRTRSKHSVAKDERVPSVQADLLLVELRSNGRYADEAQFELTTPVRELIINAHSSTIAHFSNANVTATRTNPIHLVPNDTPAGSNNLSSPVTDLKSTWNPNDENNATCDLNRAVENNRFENSFCLRPYNPQKRRARLLPQSPSES